MTSVTEAAMAASVIVGMISLPAVSQVPPAPQQMPNLTEKTPSKEVVRQSSPDGFTATISTAFQDFRTAIGANSANASLESSQARLEVEKRPSSTTWILTAPAGKMTLERQPTKVVETVETPSGTLQTIRNNGAVRERFKGSNRSRVESSASTLRKLMEKKRQDMMEKRKQVAPSGTKESPDIDLIANESTASGFGDNDREHVVIVNQGSDTAVLDGHTLRNDNPDTYEFDELEVEPGERVRVYSNDPEDVPENSVTGTGLTWANSGDTASLLEDDYLVVEKGY